MRRRAVIFLVLLAFLTANSPTIADEQLKGGALPPYAKARLGTTIFRSPVYLERMAYSPKGTYLVTLDAKGTIRFSNPKTGQLQLRLETKPPRNSRKESLFFSPDERFVFWSNAETMHCREISSGTEHYFKVDQPPCGRIALIMADEQMQFAYASGGSIFLLKGSKKSDFHALKGHLKRVTAVAASRSGQWIGSASHDGTVRVWDFRTGKEEYCFSEPKGQMNCVHFASNNLWVAAGGDDKCVRLWELKNGKPLTVLEGHETAVQHLRFSPDNQLLVSAGQLGEVIIWNVETKKIVHRWNEPSSEVCDLDISADGKILAVASAQAVRLVNLETGREALAVPAGHLATVTAIDIAADGKTMASVGSDQRCRLWNLATGRQMWEKPRLYFPKAVAVTRDGSRIADGGDGQKFILADAQSGDTIRELAISRGSVAQLDFSPDATSLAVYGHGKSQVLFVFDSMTGKCRIEREIDYGNVFETSRWMRFSPDGKSIALADLSNDVAIISATSDKLDYLLTSPPSGVVTDLAFDDAMTSLDWSGDGRLLAATMDKGLVSLWETATHTLIWQRRERTKSTPPSQNRFTRAVAVSPNGRFIATGGEDGIIRIWDNAADHLREDLKGHDGAVTTLQFTPDAKSIVSASEDTTILVWNIPPLPKDASPVAEVTEEDAKQIWLDLKADDAAKAYKSLWKAVGNPKPALALFERQLTSVAEIDEATVQTLIADLSSNSFAVRQKTFDKLAAMDTLAVRALQNRLKQKLEENEREQIEKLLRATESWSGDRLRELRAVQCVELMATPDAKMLLEKWAKGASNARLTREAKSALKRLSKNG